MENWVWPRPDIKQFESWGSRDYFLFSLLFHIICPKPLGIKLVQSLHVWNMPCNHFCIDHALAWPLLYLQITGIHFGYLIGWLGCEARHLVKVYAACFSYHIVFMLWHWRSAATYVSALGLPKISYVLSLNPTPYNIVALYWTFCKWHCMFGEESVKFLLLAIGYPLSINARSCT